MRLNEVFSRDDVANIVEWAHGHPVEAFGCNLETFDPKKVAKMSATRKALFFGEHGYSMCNLKASFGEMQVVITGDGGVSYQNWSGCRFPMAQPLKVYELVLRRMKPELFKEDVDG